MSLIEEGDEKKVRMAYLAIVCCHTVNGVAALHSDLLKTTLFKEFHELYPGKL
jgi:glycogen phosphorylase